MIAADERLPFAPISCEVAFRLGLKVEALAEEIAKTEHPPQHMGIALHTMLKYLPVNDRPLVLNYLRHVLAAGAN
jgi:hypothetical protein